MMIINNLNRNPRGRMLANRSTWLVNIGTHKKPFDEREWDILRNSLTEAIEAILNDPQFPLRCLTPMRIDEVTGRIRPPRYPEFLNLRDYGIDYPIVAEFVIERGARQGRVDAHIILEVSHSDTRLQFNVPGFTAELRRELEAQTAALAGADILTSNPAFPLQHLAWANGNPYVFGFL
jgi:hypothetical protein